MAEKIQLKLVDKLKRKERGIKTRDNIFVLKYTSMQAVLIECGFLTHLEERKLLTEDSYRNDIVSVISFGVGDYLKKGEKMNINWGLIFNVVLLQCRYYNYYSSF